MSSISLLLSLTILSEFNVDDPKLLGNNINACEHKLLASIIAEYISAFGCNPNNYGGSYIGNY